MSKEKKPISRRAGNSSEGIGKPAHLVGKSWFLGIGINQYEAFAQLHNAVKDVEDVLGVLLKQYDVDRDCVVLLKDERATREEIIDQLDQLVHQVRAEDKLIIYYSGHGHLDSRTDLGYWIPFDAKKGRTANYIRNSTIRDYVKVIKARHTLLISDSCFSGSLFVRGTARSSAALEELEQRASRWAICSGRHDEEVNDGEPGKNSPFAESILDILGGNSKRKLNVAKLADRVVELTRANYQQLPEGNPLYGVGHKGGQYVFRLKADEAADWAECEREGSVASYRTFLLKYPEGQYAESAREQLAFMEEEEAWQKARREHTVYAYFRYQQQYPQGRYQVQSLAAIKELEEEQSWSEAKRRNRLSTYQEYLREYPQGKYQAQAKQSIQALMAKEQEPHLWQQCLRSGRKADFEAYLRQYAEGRYAEEARQRLSELAKAAVAQEREQEERIAWKQAQEQDTPTAYRHFLERYPLGQFTEEGKTALARIEHQLAQEQQTKRAARLQEQAQRQEEKAWAGVVNAPSLSGVKAYLSTYPSGSYREAALKMKKELLEKRQADRGGLLKKYGPWGAGVFVVLLVLIWSISTLGGNGNTGRPQSDEAQNSTEQQIEGSTDDDGTLPPLEEEDSSSRPSVTETGAQDGKMTDSRDGQTYRTVMLNDQEWMAENLNYETSDGASWCYDEDVANCRKYGRLYTYDSALKACPPGWRLPMDEEWEVLRDSYGNSEAAYEALIDGGESGFHALLGGWRYSDGSFGNLGKYGYYWSSTAEGADDAWGYYFDGNLRELDRYYGSRSDGHSCRCLKD